MWEMLFVFIKVNYIELWAYSTIYFCCSIMLFLSMQSFLFVYQFLHSSTWSGRVALYQLYIVLHNLSYLLTSAWWCFTKLCCVIFWLVASCWCIFFTICYSSRPAVCTSSISPAYADVVSRHARLAFCTADSVLWLALHSAMRDMWHVTTLHLCHIPVVTYIHIPNYIYIFRILYKITPCK